MVEPGQVDWQEWLPTLLRREDGTQSPKSFGSASLVLHDGLGVM